jgi:hypothetical protein
VKSSQGGKLFTYMVVVEGYLGSPLGMLFLISIFWLFHIFCISVLFLLIGSVMMNTAPIILRVLFVCVTIVVAP